MTTQPQDLRHALRIKVFEPGEIKFLAETRAMHMLNILFRGALLHPIRSTLLGPDSAETWRLISARWTSGRGNRAKSATPGRESATDIPALLKERLVVLP